MKYIIQEPDFVVSTSHYYIMFVGKDRSIPYLEGTSPSQALN